MGRLHVAVLAVAVAGAGCASKAPGQPVPGPVEASTPASTSAAQAGEAPPINSPELDLASYESRVCDLLTPAQVAPFAIRERGAARDGPAGPGCSWKPPDTSAGAQIELVILSKAEGGWEGIYDRRSRYPFFEEAGEINGYPAVHRDASGADPRDAGICATAVGARRDLVFEVGVFVNGIRSPEYKNPCPVSDRVASLVIDTLRGGR